MTTKTQYISQARAANPKPQYRIENGEQIELSDAEYEASLEAWADMKIQQAAVEAEIEAKIVAKKSAQAKLAALGLDADEIAALVG